MINICRGGRDGATMRQAVGNLMLELLGIVFDTRPTVRWRSGRVKHPQVDNGRHNTGRRSEWNMMYQLLCHNHVLSSSSTFYFLLSFQKEYAIVMYPLVTCGALSLNGFLRAYLVDDFLLWYGRCFPGISHCISCTWKLFENETQTYHTALTAATFTTCC